MSPSSAKLFIQLAAAGDQQQIQGPDDLVGLPKVARLRPESSEGTPSLGKEPESPTQERNGLDRTSQPPGPRRIRGGCRARGRGASGRAGEGATVADECFRIGGNG